MANYATLKAAIQAVIYENGNQEITGSVMQATLLAMVNSLGANYQYVGIATPSTDPGTPDQNVFYLASTAGTYVNFGNIVLAENEVAILKYNGSWIKDITGFASQEVVTGLVGKVNALFEILDIETLTTQIGTALTGTSKKISNTGVWESTHYETYCIVAIQPGKIYRVVSRANRAAIISVLAQATFGNIGESVSFASGWNGEITIPAGEERVFIAPENAEGLYFQRMTEQQYWSNPDLYEIEYDSTIISELISQVFGEREASHTETDITSALTPYTSSRGVQWNTGALYSSSNYDASGYVDVSAYKRLKYSRAKSAAADTALGVAFYDAEQHYISGQQAFISSPANGYVEQEIDVPNGAKFFRMSIRKDTSSWGNPYLIGIAATYERYSKIELLQEEIDAIVISGGGNDTLKLNQQDIVDLNAISANGGFELKTNMGCTDYIPCHGATTISYKQVVGVTGAGLAFYDQDKNFISGSYVDSISGTNGYANNVVAVPNNAYYFRASGWNYANSQILGEFSAVLSATGICLRGKRASNGESTFFSVVYNAAIDDLSVSNFSNPSQGNTPVCTTGVVLLPPSYSLDGKPSPVIVTFHGWSHYVNYKQWGAPGSENAGFMMQKQRWANAGFVVIDVNHKNASQKENYSGLGSKQDDECYRKAWEWVKQNYNVEDMCHIVCGSAGGINGINATYDWPDVKSAVWLDCWVDVAENPFPESCGAYYYGFSGAYDAAKVGTRNPILRIKSIDGVDYLQMPQCPVKLYPLTLSVSGFLKPFVDVINAGNAIGDFYIRHCSGITHSVLVSGGDGTDPQAEVVDLEIIRFLSQL